MKRALLLALCCLTACNEAEDPEFSTRPPVTPNERQPGGGGGGFARFEDADPDRPPRDAGETDPDAAIPTDAEPPTPDATLDAAIPPDADLAACDAPDDCTFFVRLDRCDPCPTAHTDAEAATFPCTEPYVFGATLAAYGRPDCTAACPEEQTFVQCLDPPFQATCGEDGRCLATQ